MIWNIYERMLWIVAFTLFIVGGLEYARKGREKDQYNERILMYGFASLLFGFAFTVFFLFMSDLTIPGTYRNLAFYGEYGASNNTFKIFFRLTLLSFMAGYTLFFLAFEISVKRMKFIPSIIGFVGITLFIITPWDFILYIILIAGISFVVLLIILSLCIKWSDPEFKVIASYITLGTFFSGHGIPMGVFWIKSLWVIPIWVAPLMTSLAGLFYLLPILIKPVEFSRNQVKIWMGINIVTFTLQILMLGIYINNGFPIPWTIATVLVLAVLIYIQFVYFKTMKQYFSREETLKSEETPLNVLEVFSKPQRLTEEEVSISKEKKICLVCKAKLGGLMFMCKECEAFYCEKCSSALSNLENLCWVCETPFDTTKLSKPFKKEGQKIDLEITEKSRKEAKIDQKLGGDLK